MRPSRTCSGCLPREDGGEDEEACGDGKTDGCTFGDPFWIVRMYVQNRFHCAIIIILSVEGSRKGSDYGLELRYFIIYFQFIAGTLRPCSSP